MADNVSKSVTVPTFSKKIEDFELFLPRMKAYVSMKGFSDSIDPLSVDLELPTPFDAISTTDANLVKEHNAAV